jgi:chaperonin GroES
VELVELILVGKATKKVAVRLKSSLTVKKIKIKYIVRRIFMTSSIQPLYDRVLVKRLESEQVSAGGIIIPDTAQEKTQMGAVIAAGDGKLLNDGSLRALSIKAGDKVVFGKYAGTEIKVGSDEFLVLREDELLAIVNK